MRQSANTSSFIPLLQSQANELIHGDCLRKALDSLLPLSRATTLHFAKDTASELRVRDMSSKRSSRPLYLVQDESSGGHPHPHAITRNLDITDHDVARDVAA